MSSEIFSILPAFFGLVFLGLALSFRTAGRINFGVKSGDEVWGSRLISRYYRKPMVFILSMDAAIVVFWTTALALLNSESQRLSISFVLLAVSYAVFLISSVFVFIPFASRLLRYSAVLLFPVYILFYPLAKFLVGGMEFLKGIKLSEYVLGTFSLTKEELNALLENRESEEGGEENKNEIKFFRNALDFSDIKLKECIVPRTNMVALPLESSTDEVLKLLSLTGFSRILIYKNSIDNIIGYVHSSAFFHNPESVNSILTKILIVPETMSALKLLRRFIRERRSIAVVVDEFGVTAGMVTIEDIMEEIFGEIEDEHDKSRLKEEVLEDGTYVFSGRLDVDYINEKYGIGLPENEEYETLAGLVLYYNESIPREHEVIPISSRLSIEVIRMDKARIEDVKLKLIS